MGPGVYVVSPRPPTGTWSNDDYAGPFLMQMCHYDPFSLSLFALFPFFFRGYSCGILRARWEILEGAKRWEYVRFVCKSNVSWWCSFLCFHFMAKISKGRPVVTTHLFRTTTTLILCMHTRVRILTFLRSGVV
jgi:hypothetical protein